MEAYDMSVRDIEKENCPLIYWWHMAIQLLASNNRVDEFFATYLVVFCISEKKIKRDISPEIRVQCGECSGWVLAY